MIRSLIVEIEDREGRCDASIVIDETGYASTGMTPAEALRNLASLLDEVAA